MCNIFQRGVVLLVRPAIEHAQDVLYWWVRPVEVYLLVFL